MKHFLAEEQSSLEKIHNVVFRNCISKTYFALNI